MGKRVVNKGFGKLKNFPNTSKNLFFPLVLEIYIVKSSVLNLLPLEQSFYRSFLVVPLFFFLAWMSKHKGSFYYHKSANNNPDVQMGINPR